MKILKKYIAWIIVLFLFLFFKVDFVPAACTPDECGNPGCDLATEHCSAKCCVPNTGGTGGTGGGGGGCPNPTLNQACPTTCGYPGGAVQGLGCTIKICPAVVNVWSAWGTCFGGCGGPGAGIQYRTDTCGNSQSQACNLPACCAAAQSCPTYCGYPGGTVPNGSCGTTSCPAKAACACVHTTWGAYGACSVPCGGGTQTRTDNCGTTQSQACNIQSCACVHTSWGVYDACTQSCGGGTQTRTDNCGATETQACNTNPCVTTSWWQVEGAGVYAGSDAGGVTIESQLPSASTTLVVPATGGTDSVVLRGSGSMSLGSGTVSSALWNTVAKYKGKRMDYSYFSANMGVLRNQASDWQSDTLNLQAYNPSKEFWYTAPTSGEATISVPWTVGVGEKYIVFVNGDLLIDSNITVADGGYLAFIVNGGVTVDPSVTSMQGLYVMDNNFTTETVDSTGAISDVALNVEGSVVAWGTFGLHRDLGLSNGSTPAEKFSYRPDLLVNMPPKMKSFALHWSEVPAGTFGN